MEIAVVAGFAAFLGKYLEQQFNLTTSSANQLLGRQANCFSIKHQGRRGSVVVKQIAYIDHICAV